MRDFSFPDDEMSKERLAQLISNIPLGETMVITDPSGNMSVVSHDENGFSVTLMEPEDGEDLDDREP